MIKIVYFHNRIYRRSDSNLSLLKKKLKHISHVTTTTCRNPQAQAPFHHFNSMSFTYFLYHILMVNVYIVSNHHCNEMAIRIF